MVAIMGEKIRSMGERGAVVAEVWLGSKAKCKCEWLIDYVIGWIELGKG